MDYLWRITRISGATQTRRIECTKHGALKCGDGVVVTKIPVMVTSITSPAKGPLPGIIAEIDAKEVEYCWFIIRNKQNGGNIELHITSKADHGSIIRGDGATVNKINVVIIGKALSAGASSATIAATEAEIDP